TMSEEQDEAYPAPSRRAATAALFRLARNAFRVSAIRRASASSFTHSKRAPLGAVLVRKQSRQSDPSRRWGVLQEEMKDANQFRGARDESVVLQPSDNRAPNSGKAQQRLSSRGDSLRRENNVEVIAEEFPPERQRCC